MYELMVESCFSSAHQLRGYKGKCEEMHGHNWRVQVSITSDKLNDLGLAMDFHDLKLMVNEVVSSLDHCMLNEVFPFTEINPSSENIGKWIYDSIKKKMGDTGCEISSVTVWESETCSATYYE